MTSNSSALRWVSTQNSGMCSRRSDLLEVGPRRVRPLGHGVGALVEDLVEDLEALVGQAHLVGVRVHQEPPDPVRGGRRDLGTELAADVARWLLHRGEVRLETSPDVDHGWFEGTGRVPVSRHHRAGGPAGPMGQESTLVRASAPRLPAICRHRHRRTRTRVTTMLPGWGSWQPPRWSAERVAPTLWWAWCMWCWWWERCWW